MRDRRYTRRAAVRTLGLGLVGTLTSGTDAGEPGRRTPDGQRDEDRIRFVEADPSSGFNYPYWLATPETFRSEPIPLLVEMNSAREGRPVTGGGPDQPPTVAEMSQGQVRSFDFVGAWVSEQLGVPQLVPMFPKPDGDPVDNTHKTTLLDRETMLIEGNSLERIDRQLLRMTEHARREILTDHRMHDELLFWGNSSGGVAAEHMAVMHPGEIMAFAGAGINGIATLPLAELGTHTLKYPVGVADLEAVTGQPFDAAAFDEVNKFYIQGGRDTHNRLKFFDDRDVDGTGVWADPEVYATAKAVYGRDMVEDRLPRCHVAFEKAGVSGQFRVYPEMRHDPERAGPDVLEFLRRSIEGDEVSGFGQRLELPLDRTPEVVTRRESDGHLDVSFEVSGEYPPPEGLVAYNWNFGGRAIGSGRTVEHTYETPGTYTVTLWMETPHRQMARATTEVAYDAPLADVDGVALSREEIPVGGPVTVRVTVTNAGTAAGEVPVELAVDGEVVATKRVELAVGKSGTVTFERRFDAPGEYELRINGWDIGTVQVVPTPTATSSPTAAPTGRATETETQTPGFGMVPAAAGLGATVAYLLSRDDADDR